MATVTCLLTQNGTAGSYWSGLPVTDPGDGGNYRDRYFHGGVYKVFSRMHDFKIAVLDGERSFLVDLVLEIQGKWDDTYTSWNSTIFFDGFHSCTVTTRVNGEYDPDSYHYGVMGGGYRRVYTYNTLASRCNGPGLILDGVEFVCNGVGHLDAAGGAIIRSCIFTGNLASGSYGVTSRGTIENTIFSNFATGIIMTGFAAGTKVQNCMAVQCGTGINGVNHNYAFVSNNIMFDNTTNWGTSPSSGSYSHNAGVTGDTIWDSDASSVMVTASDFKNYQNPLTSSTDLSPSGDSVAHTSSSLFVDNGVHLFSSFNSGSINGLARPSYKNGDSTGWDVGPYEFDWGYGLAPKQVTISISGMAEGSVLAIYKTSDGSAIVPPTTIGASGSHSIAYSYTGDTQIEVRVRKGTEAPFYLPYKAPGLITDTGFALIVSQIPDTVLNNA